MGYGAAGGRPGRSVRRRLLGELVGGRLDRRDERGDRGGDRPDPGWDGRGRRPRGASRGQGVSGMGGHLRRGAWRPACGGRGGAEGAGRRHRRGDRPGGGHAARPREACPGGPADRHLRRHARTASGNRAGGEDRELPGDQRADRRRRLHHAVELPPPPDRREGRACTRCRLHGGREAERAGAAQRVHPRGIGRRGRPAAGRVQPRHGFGPRGRRGARSSPGCRHAHVHRVDPGGASGQRRRR